MQALQREAEDCIVVGLTVTTNTVSVWNVDPKHDALNTRIAGLAAQGLTMQWIAEALNEEGVRSVTGKTFHAALIGALLSKFRRKQSDHYSLTVVMMIRESPSR